MVKIVLFGTGNLATHLFKALDSLSEFSVIQVYNHQSESLEFFKDRVETTTSLTEIKKADLYLLAVADNQIENIANRITENSALLVHTSGTVPLLKNRTRSGVFYPVYTFSKQVEVNFSEIPIALEADSQEDLKLLEKLANQLSDKVFHLNSSQRKSLHLAAVFACNFSNQLYQIAANICAENEVAFEILHPLIGETAQKIKYNTPREVQTGPAVRRDSKTIKAQINQLKSAKLKEIYTLLTEMIQEENERKL